MTNGIVSLIINGQMMFKLITGHDGQGGTLPRASVP